MNDKDKEAFKVWVYKDVLADNEIKLLHNMDKAEIIEFASHRAWQAACEYKQKEIDARKSELDYAATILTDVQADKLEMRGTIQKLQAENAKLRECVEFYAENNNWYSLSEKYEWSWKLENKIISNDLYTYIPSGFVEKFHCGGKRARQVLKELDEKL